MEMRVKRGIYEDRDWKKKERRVEVVAGSSKKGEGRIREEKKTKP